MLTPRKYQKLTECAGSTEDKSRTQAQQGRLMCQGLPQHGDAEPHYSAEQTGQGQAGLVTQPDRGSLHLSAGSFPSMSQCPGAHLMSAVPLYCSAVRWNFRKAA